MSKKKNDKPELSKDELIEFLASATPQEVAELISNRGKPRKLYNPFYTFRNKDDESIKSNGG